MSCIGLVRKRPALGRNVFLLPTSFCILRYSCRLCILDRFRKVLWRSFGTERKPYRLRHLGRRLWSSSVGPRGWVRWRWDQSSNRGSFGMLGLCRLFRGRSAVRGIRSLLGRVGRCFVCRRSLFFGRCSVPFESIRRKSRWWDRRRCRCFGRCNRRLGCSRWGGSVVWRGHKRHLRCIRLVRK